MVDIGLQPLTIIQMAAGPDRSAMLLFGRRAVGVAEPRGGH
jgi:hypothetical protein